MKVTSSLPSPSKSKPDSSVFKSSKSPNFFEGEETVAVLGTAVVEIVSRAGAVVAVVVVATVALPVTVEVVVVVVLLAVVVVGVAAVVLVEVVVVAAASVSSLSLREIQPRSAG